MEYTTKRERMQALIHAYEKASGMRIFTIDDVANWADDHGLRPVPRRGDPETVCADWERRLKEIAP